MKFLIKTQGLRKCEFMAVDLQRRVFEKPHRVLLVGEGNFSFALAYAKRHPGREIVATSYDSLDEVKKYHDFEKINRELVENFPNVIIEHGKDATKLETYFDWTEHQFDKIIFNFPHVGKRSKETAKLVDKFFQSSRNVLAPNGTVQMGLVDTLHYDKLYGIRASLKHRFRLIERKKFDASGYYKKNGYTHLETKRDARPKKAPELKYVFQKIEDNDKTFDSGDEFLHSSDLSLDEGRPDQFQSVYRREGKGKNPKTISKTRNRRVLIREYGSLREAHNAANKFLREKKDIRAAKLYSSLAKAMPNISSSFKKVRDSIISGIRLQKTHELNRLKRAEAESHFNLKDEDYSELFKALSLQ